MRLSFLALLLAGSALFAQQVGARKPTPDDGEQRCASPNGRGSKSTKCPNGHRDCQKLKEHSGWIDVCWKWSAEKEEWKELEDQPRKKDQLPQDVYDEHWIEETRVRMVTKQAAIREEKREKAAIQEKKKAAIKDKKAATEQAKGFGVMRMNLGETGNKRPIDSADAAGSDSKRSATIQQGVHHSTVEQQPATNPVVAQSQQDSQADREAAAEQAAAARKRPDIQNIINHKPPT